MTIAEPIDPHRESEIAVIGLSGLFPARCAAERSSGGPLTSTEAWSVARVSETGSLGNLAALRESLWNGLEAISFFSREELLEAGVSAEEAAAPDYIPARAVLENIDLFSALFFGFSPREAGMLDPQHRLFLECAWEAFENAGYDPRRFAGPIGVFAGSSLNRHALEQLARSNVGSIDRFDVRLANGADFLSTRVSYKLHLKGPSLTVQTACSTSLVATHLACQSLLAGECDLALAGGVSLAIPQKVGYRYHENSIASPDGHCRAFDAKAAGTVGGSGIGAVVLKRLEEALADGDRIDAVIRGSAINNDGSSKIGYTAPSIDGQAAVIEEAQAAADVHPDSVTYVEAHGSGTPLGDPIEVAALTQAFRAGTDRKQFCALGSIKTNIGHLDAAAGIAGLIKTVLALKAREIPPSLHFEEPNPQIPFETSPFYVNTELRPWPRGATPRRAGISSFGIGGTNVHLVLEESPPIEPSGASRPAQLLVLSARTPTALDLLSDSIADFLAAAEPPPDLADVAFTLQVGRAQLEHRRIVVAAGRDEAVAALRGGEAGRAPSALVHGGDRGICLLLPDTGRPSAELVRELCLVEADFRQEIDLCAEILDTLDCDLRAILQPDEDDPLRWRSAEAEPAFFAFLWALAKLWKSWGIDAAALFGEGLGELVAATLAGVFELEDALALAVERGRLRAALPAAPVAVQSTALAPYARLLASIELAMPRIPFVSSLSGTWIRPEQAADPAYWIRSQMEPSRTSAALATLLESPERILLEVGPDGRMTDLARQHPSTAKPADDDARAAASAGPTLICSLPESAAGGGMPSSGRLLDALGRLWLAGVEVDWDGFYGDERRLRVELPTYPFERQRYPLEIRPFVDQTPPGTAQERPRRVDDWTYVPQWRRDTSPRKPTSPAALAEAGRWLILGGNSPLGRALTEALRGAGARLLADLATGDELPDRIVHLGAFAAKHDAHAKHGERPERSLELFADLVEIGRAWAARPDAPPLRLDVVASGLCEVLGDEILEPENAVLLGPVRVLPQELPGAACRAIDLLADTPLDQLAAQLLDELALPFLEDQRWVARRGGARWLPVFERLELTAAPTDEAPLRRGGTYLITGGLGGVGAEIARHFAAVAGARLALLGRSDFPAAETWPGLLDDPATAPELRRRIERLRAIEQAGGEILTVQADVADPAALRRAVDRVRERFGPIHGVVHAAGEVGGGLLQMRSDAEIRAVLAPKILGTRAIEEIFRDAEPKLDFLVLCSSLNGPLGGIGHGDYCAANAFLDAFAHRNGLDGATTVAIDWDRWRGVGTAATATDHTGLRGGAETGMETAEGLEILRRALLEGRPQILVSTDDLPTLAARAARLRADALEQSAAAATGEAARNAQTAAAPSHPRPQLFTPYRAPESELEEHLVKLWRSFLGIAEIGVDDNFFELGGHSLMATQILGRVRGEFGAALTLPQFFEIPTVGELAQAVELLRSMDAEGDPGAADDDGMEEGLL